MIDQASAFLAALAPLPAGDWRSLAEAAARKSGLPVETERQRIRVAGERRRSGDYQFSDDIVLSRLWLAPQQSGIAATPHRRYFDPQSGALDTRPERRIVGDRRPQGPSSIETVGRCHVVLAAIADGLPKHTGLASVMPVEIEAAEIRVGSVTLRGDERLNVAYKNHGFDHVPQSWLVSVCPMDGVSEGVAAEVTGRLTRAAGQRSTPLRTQVISMAAIVDRLAERGSGPPATGRTVLFVFPSKHRPASDAGLRVMQAMDDAGVHYRRSYADDSLDYSIPDQLPSILLASGGRPHQVAVGDGETWSVGIDLSHSRGRDRSVLACTLIAPDGSLSGSWLTNQRRDETVLIRSLVKCLYAVREHLAYRNAFEAPLVIMRDGRLFERESTSAFAEAIGNPFVLLEFRKRRNPPVLTIDGGARGLPAPFAVQVPDSETVFLAPTPPRDGYALPALAKVTWRNKWNRLGWGPQQVASFLAAQTLTPGLGLHRRTLPAALYWADGIAGASDSDLRFRGNAPVWL